MTLLPINALLIGLVSTAAIVVMFYWNTSTRGSWKNWPAGRSLMTLLAVIAVITANAAINMFLPRYPGKVELYFTLYIVMLGAILQIGLTIRSEMRKGRARLVTKKPDVKGPVIVTVASTNNAEPIDTVPDD